MTPMNIISEIATPVSMAFRHYGNILSGYIVGLLLYGALGAASQALLGGLPGILGDFPLLQIGIPAVLNLYRIFRMLAAVHLLYADDDLCVLGGRDGITEKTSTITRLPEHFSI